VRVTSETRWYKVSGETATKIDSERLSEPTIEVSQQTIPEKGYPHHGSSWAIQTLVHYR